MGSLGGSTEPIFEIHFLSDRKKIAKIENLSKDKFGQIWTFWINNQTVRAANRTNGMAPQKCNNSYSGK